MNPTDFPVLEHTQTILASLQTNQITILQAPPGSGKTTVLPIEILRANILSDKKILMLETRRIAAKNAAIRLSFMNKSKIGEEIGYRIRFESKVSSHTKLEVVTDGILTKLLLSDPELSEYGLIVFDEFHERNLDSDFCLSLIREVQRHFRQDLKALIMSATLEGIPFSEAGIKSQPIASEGKSYPVEIIYQGDSSKRQSIRLAELIPKALEKHDGDILVFFSGISEINETAKELANTIGHLTNTVIFKLFGDMSFEEQEKVFLPANPGQRKIILATNLAESSVTLSNVRVVIDTGYCKRSIYDPSSGLTKLVKKRISLASAKQRAGRSGREAPGTCYRLWTKEEESNFVTAHPPEILETDSSKLILLSKIWGEELTNLPLLDCPSTGILSEMSDLLVRLGCLDDKQNLTTLGKQAALLPIPLRLAVMCLILGTSGRVERGIDLALCFSERRFLSDVTPTQNFELIWDKWMRLPNLNAFPKLKMIRDQLLQTFTEKHQIETKLKVEKLDSPGILLSLAYPDRIAKARTSGSHRYKMANGKGAYLPEGMSLKYPDWIVVLESDGNETDAKINLYCELVESEVLSLYSHQIHLSISSSIEENEKKVPMLKTFEKKNYGEITFKKTPSTGKGQMDEKKTKIQEYFQKRGILSFLESDEDTKQYLYRIDLLYRNGILDQRLDENYLLTHLEDWLYPRLDFEKESLLLLDFKILDALQSLLTYQQKEILKKEAPSHLLVPSGSNLPILYTETNPILAVKLQEMFGLSETPRIAKGRIPITLHLLSPSKRPVQVTTDLKNFWDATYHEVKKELKGRYPKHPWPDSPWEAVASRGTKKRTLN